MKQKILGTRGALLLLCLLAGCNHPDAPDGKTSGITVTNVPAVIGRGSDKDAASYKIYVQISSGTDQSAGYAAKGEAAINGKSAVTITELKAQNGNLWSGSGSYNLAITVSPQSVSAKEDILVKAVSSAKLGADAVVSFDWNSALDLWGLGMTENINALYEGVVLPDPEIGNPSSPLAERISVTNIPGTTDRTGHPGAASYKLYVQIADSAKTVVANASALIGNQPELTLDLKNPQGQPWKGKGTGFTIAAIISPQSAGSREDILVKAEPNALVAGTTIAFPWDTRLDLWQVQRPDAETLITAIYNEIIKKDPQITTP
ncbi:MAG: hypothetical protein LBG87_00625 [Spirochaetaceae bacterium]|jgi:hypothetical protein|nr:hypothetical protein [Spirochaetaceae bacterium]